MSFQDKLIPIQPAQPQTTGGFQSKLKPIVPQQPSAQIQAGINPLTGKPVSDQGVLGAARDATVDFARNTVGDFLTAGVAKPARRFIEGAVGVGVNAFGTDEQYDRFRQATQKDWQIPFLGGEMTVPAQKQGGEVDIGPVTLPGREIQSAVGDIAKAASYTYSGNLIPGKNLSWMQKALGFAKEGAIDAGLYGFGESMQDTKSFEDVTKDTVRNAAVGAVAAPIVGGAITALPPMYNKVAPLFSKEGREQVANALMDKVGRINPTKVNKFQDMTGKTPGEYLVDNKIFGDTEEVTTQLWKRHQESKAAVDKIFENVQGTFKYEPVGTALEELYGTLQRASTPGAQDPLLQTVTTLYNKFKTDGLSMSEINEAKRLYEKVVKTNYVKTNVPEKVRQATNVDSAIREWQIETASKAGYKNVRELNKDTQSTYLLADEIWKKYSGQSGNNAVSLTDWILLSADPTGASLPAWATKKFFGSKKAQSFMAKLLAGSGEGVPPAASYTPPLQLPAGSPLTPGINKLPQSNVPIITPQRVPDIEVPNRFPQPGTGMNVVPQSSNLLPAPTGLGPTPGQINLPARNKGMLPEEIVPPAFKSGEILPTNKVESLQEARLPTEKTSTGEFDKYLTENPKVIYHGTNARDAQSIVENGFNTKLSSKTHLENPDTVFASLVKEATGDHGAGTYGDTILEIYPRKDAKILGEEGWYATVGNSRSGKESKEYYEMLRKQGYDGLIDPSGEVMVLNPDKFIIPRNIETNNVLNLIEDNGNRLYAEYDKAIKQFTLNDLSVPEFDRNKSYGTQLVNRFEKWVAKNGGKEAYVKSTDEAIGFYQKLGYKIKQVFEDFVLMMKKIDADEGGYIKNPVVKKVKHAKFVPRLYHGTTIKNAEAISKNGFKIGKSTTSELKGLPSNFGSGIYFSPSREIAEAAASGDLVKSQVYQQIDALSTLAKDTTTDKSIVLKNIKNFVPGFEEFLTKNNKQHLLTSTKYLDEIVKELAEHKKTFTTTKGSVMKGVKLKEDVYLLNLVPDGSYNKNRYSQYRERAISKYPDMSPGEAMKKLITDEGFDGVVTTANGLGDEYIIYNTEKIIKE